MKKYIRILAMVAAFLLAASGCTSQTGNSNNNQTGAEKIEIGIIQYAEHVALDSAREGFIDALRDNGYVDGIADLLQAAGE
jgi:putative ABC transport system substrate-binding protein